MDISNLMNSLRSKLGLPDKQGSLLGLRQEYTRYNSEAQMRGEQPVPFEEFVRMKQMENRAVPKVGGPISDRDAEMMRR